MAAERRRQSLRRRWNLSVDSAFFASNGLISPGHSFSLLTQRHMHLYGTKREHLAEIAISERENAIRRPTSLHRTPLTLDDYFNARMISDPLCLFDYTMESDGAVAVITTSAERARDLRQPPVYVLSSANGGMGRWGPALFTYFQQPDEYFASSGHRPVAQRMYEMAGVTPDDVDVALLYDHFTPMVLMQIEDYGFCPIGEGGPFVAEGNIRWPDRQDPGEHARREPVGGVHHRHDAHPRSGRAAARHRDQPGRERRDRAGHRRSGRAAGERHAVEEMIDDREPDQACSPRTQSDPYADDYTQPFWDAALDGRLVAPRCTKCGTFRAPSRSVLLRLPAPGRRLDRAAGHRHDLHVHGRPARAVTAARGRRPLRDRA